MFDPTFIGTPKFLDPKAFWAQFFLEPTMFLAGSVEWQWVEETLRDQENFIFSLKLTMHSCRKISGLLMGVLGQLEVTWGCWE